ncbi:MAG: VWA domain-containing protein [Bacteroidales bacterium]|jgi:Ca-activated chloride channel family protein|nr:VWA domain-containing protein [Bacteroidales bacterium]
MQLFRFANPEFLYLLLILPVLVGLFIINRVRSRNAIRKLGDAALISRLMPELSGPRPVLKFILLLASISSIIIALARPQYGSKLEEIRKQGVEVIIALDVSNSMLAEDIQPDRLTRAKQAISRLVDNLSNDKIGLIVFAGDAYTQIPITTDYISAKMFLSTIGPDMVPKQGTAIGAAIRLASGSFTPGEGKSRAIIIITDGENHEDEPLKEAEEAAKAGIVIHTIGIGSSEGVPIPLSTGGRKDYLKDQDGTTVITRLDEEILKKIAVTGGGNYIRASSSSIGLDEIFSDIRKMDQSELESSVYTEYNDQFQIFAALALILLVIEIIIMERKNRKLQNVRLFRFKI